MNIITVEHPQAQIEWLRFQVGFMEIRNSIVPRYVQRNGVRSFDGLNTSRSKVEVFHLLGWGKTVEAAERMARRSDLWPFDIKSSLRPVTTEQPSEPQTTQTAQHPENPA